MLNLFLSKSVLICFICMVWSALVCFGLLWAVSIHHLNAHTYKWEGKGLGWIERPPNANLLIFIFIHFINFQPFSSKSIHFHPLLFTFIHCWPLLTWLLQLVCHGLSWSALVCIGLLWSTLVCLGVC